MFDMDNLGLYSCEWQDNHRGSLSQKSVYPPPLTYWMKWADAVTLDTTQELPPVPNCSPKRWEEITCIKTSNKTPACLSLSLSLSLSRLRLLRPCFLEPRSRDPLRLLRLSLSFSRSSIFFFLSSLSFSLSFSRSSFSLAMRASLSGSSALAIL